jgi:hypothetical protein
LTSDEVGFFHQGSKERGAKASRRKRSVLHVMQDPVVGKGQKGFAFCKCIFEHYDQRRPHSFRPARLLESKWGQIKYDIAKFISVYYQCVNLNKVATWQMHLSRGIVPD